MDDLIKKIKEIAQSLKASKPAQATALLAAVAALSFATYKTTNNKAKTNEAPIESEDISTQPVSQQPNNEAYRNIASSDDSYEQCKATVLPSFINISLTWFGSSWGEALGHLSPPSVIVTAAGNSYPKPVPPEKVKISQDIDAIIVGSISPDGRRSRFSQEHQEVHIMAPSDYYQSSTDEHGNRIGFGGTSGAAPLVTGSLAAFEWLSGYHPTAKEAKILLQKTAIPHQHVYDDPQKNGVGIVNAYKMGMVGKKLKEVCGTDIYCFKNRIQKESSYSFPEDEGLLTAVKQAFPQCSSDNCNTKSSFSCEDKTKVFKRLRKAALLNPDNKKLWKYIACAYNSSGFTKNGQGIINIYKSLYNSPDNNEDAYTFCHTDINCVFIPSFVCGSKREANSVPIIAATVAEADIYYAEQHCSPKSLCNNKCRCDNQETIQQNHIQKISTFSSQCVNSKCVINKDSETDIQDTATTPLDLSSPGKR